MPPSRPVLRLRLLRLLGAVAAGLVLVFGGTCGAGPTSLSLLAVSAPQSTPPDDARSQAPVPVAAEAAVPERRVLRRHLARWLLPSRARALLEALVAGASSVTTTRGPPPLRGPPVLLG